MSLPVVELLLAFLVVSVAFLLLARSFARRPETDAWWVAAALACVSVVVPGLLVIVHGYGPEYFYYTWKSSYVGSIALAGIWWLLRTRTPLLGKDPGSRSDTPVRRLWVAAVPAGGLLLSFAGMWEYMAPHVTAIWIAVIQLAAIGLVWRIRIKLATPMDDLESLLATGGGQDELSVGVPELRADRVPSPGPPARSRVSEAAAEVKPVVTAPVVPESPAPSSAPSAPPVSPDRESKIFLSYRRDDSADVAGRIYDRLVERFGKKQVFKDVDSIPLGVDFRRHLDQMVASCDVLLAVMGDRWLTVGGPEGKKRLDDAKDFVRIELEAALKREIPVIPVLVRGADVPQESELPPSLSGLAYRNGLAVRPDPDFHRDMDRLIEGVQNHLNPSL